MQLRSHLRFVRPRDSRAIDWSRSSRIRCTRSRRKNLSRIDRAIAIVIEMKATKAIKVCLTNRGEDQETPWAHDLGPAPGPKGSRKVRLVNVPFLHAKPTWGDVIVVSPVEDGFPTWDRDGVPWTKVGT